MVFPGIVRRVNKTLPALLQMMAVIFLIHYIAQGFLTKIQKTYHQDHYTRIKGASHAHGKILTQSATGGPNALKLRLPSRSTTTTTTTTTTPPPFLPDDIIAQEQARRLDTLHTACSKWNMGLWSSGEKSNLTEEISLALAAVPKSPLYQALIVSDEKKLAVCPASRTGLQWLSRRLLLLTGKFDENKIYRLHEPPYTIARHNFPYLSSWEKYPVVLAQSVTMLMGRHPLDRILASYRHMLEDAEKNPHGYLHYGRRIVRSYRKAPTPTKGPTFEEFVRFLLEHESHHLDEAWQSIVRRCTPCHIPYNAVLHYETLWYDVKWAWKKAGLGILNTTDYFAQQVTPQVRREYFSELTLSQILALYKKYQLDFEIFGYTLDDHLAYAKPGNEALDPAVMNNLPRQNPDKLENLLIQIQNQKEMQDETVSKEKEGARDVLKPPPESADGSSMSLSLTGERHQPVEMTSNLAPPDDNRDSLQPSI